MVQKPSKQVDEASRPVKERIIRVPQALVGEPSSRQPARSSGPRNDKIQKVWTPWSQEAHYFVENFATLANTSRRFPRSLRALESYIVPTAVAIGPYHRGLMEEVKKAAADHFVRESGRSFDDIYREVAKTKRAALDFYGQNYVERNMNRKQFLFMLFYDACFLLQFMVKCTCKPDKLHPSLWSFFDNNEAVISKDIMLLENQLPWVVLDALKIFKNVDVLGFVAKMGRTLQVRKERGRETFKLGTHRPPHLLGVLWYYKTGSRTDEVSIPISDGLIKPVSRTVSAIELAEIGIGLKASKTAKFRDMGINKVPLFTNIFLPPVLLDHVRASWLVNMVAFEVSLGTRNPSVVSSYIAILSMLMDREEDVHKLRADGVVQGELTNKEILDFFKTVIKHISGGDPYSHIIQEVEDYKAKCWMWIIMHKFFYKNWKTIAAVLTIVAVLLAILNLKRHW